MSYGEFAEFLGASLELLRENAPRTHRRLREQLAGETALIRIDQSQFGLIAGANCLAIGAPPDSPTIEIVTTKATVLDLLDARASLLAVVRDDRLMLKGSTSGLAAFFAALQTYVRGAMRVASFERLLAAYRRDASLPAPMQSKKEHQRG